MKVVHIIPTLSAGGAERMLSKICNYDNDNEHVVVTLLKYSDHYDVGKVELINLNLENNLKNKVLAIYKLLKIIKQLKPDVIQTWMKTNFYGPFVKFFIRKPLISNFRNGYLGSKNILYIRLLNLFYRFFDGHIFVSNSAYEERTQNGFKFKNYIIIENGFEIKLNSKRKTNDIFTIGHLGRYHTVKNQQLIVDGFREFSKNINDTKLLLAGRNLNPQYLDVTGIPSTKIEFYGELKDVHDFYKKLDLFILTSKSEGFPNVIGEAMSNSVPVLSTNAGESFKIMGETGYKLLTPTQAELSKLLKHIYTNQDELKNSGKQSFLRIQKDFSLESTIDKYKSYYRKVVQQQ